MNIPIDPNCLELDLVETAKVPNTHPRRKLEREAQIVAMLNRGATLRAVAKYFGLSEGRTAYIRDRARWEQ